MKLWIILVIIAVVLALALAGSYVMFRYTFSYVPGHRRDPRVIPDDYGPYKEQMEEMIREADAANGEKVAISSDDHIRLHATLYHPYPGAPTILFLHGYRSSQYWDGYGCMRICRECHYNLLLAEQRAHGDSACRALTFGIRERKDCCAWAQYLTDRFGEDERIFLFGVSMGGATVTMAAQTPLPDTVKGIIADCGYTSPKAIICNTGKNQGFPVGICYVLVKLGALLYGGFNVEAASSLEAVRQCKVPILFIHGDQDDFVPTSMCDELYEACTAPKERLYVRGAGHANSFLVDYAGYRDAVVDFIMKLA